MRNVQHVWNKNKVGGYPGNAGIVQPQTDWPRDLESFWWEKEKKNSILFSILTCFSFEKNKIITVVKRGAQTSWEAVPTNFWKERETQLRCTKQQSYNEMVFSSFFFDLISRARPERKSFCGLSYFSFSLSRTRLWLHLIINSFSRAYFSKRLAELKMASFSLVKWINFSCCCYLKRKKPQEL